jgi:CxxC motif-containing protein
MESKEMICIVCPIGCSLQVSRDGCGCQVEGNQCAKGKNYAIDELTNPLRTVTTTIATAGANTHRLPVRTDQPFPKDKIMELMKILKQMRVKLPVKAGQVLLENALGTNVNVISSRTLS